MNFELGATLHDLVRVFTIPAREKNLDLRLALDPAVRGWWWATRCAWARF